jgi:hypothetical protein
MTYGSGGGRRARGRHLPLRGGHLDTHVAARHARHGEEWHNETAARKWGGPGLATGASPARLIRSRYG